MVSENYMVLNNYSFKYFYPIQNLLTWFQVFLSDTNDLQAVIWFQVSNDSKH